MILSSVSLLILGVIWGTSLNVKGRSLLMRYHLRVFYTSALTLFSYAAYLGVRLYKATYAHPIGKFFDIEYVLFFRVGVRLFAPYLASLVFAIIFMWVATAYNKRYNERFFEREEIQLGGLSLLLVGHPGWIFYLITLVALYLLLHTTYYLLHTNKNFRLPVYRLWVPTAIFVILISKYWISGSVFWIALQF